MGQVPYESQRDIPDQGEFSERKWITGRKLIIGASRSSDAKDADGIPNQYKHTSLTVVGVRRLVEVALPRQQ